MEKEGIEFLTNVEVGQDISSAELKQCKNIRCKSRI
jgi:NADPH-dependent glutamate synthase beta subunit-like oxidoreductase